MKTSFQNFKESAVYKDILINKLNHSILLISPDNYALENYAKNLIMSLMCEGEDKPCMQCNECKKIIHNNNVDVMYYPKGDIKAINSSEIGDLIENAFSAPYEADKKIFVIKNANGIDAGMQNKLLKTLEEPPHNTYFILLATMDNNILSTIKSRCRIVRVPSIEKEEIFQVLQDKNISNDAINLAIRYCDNNCDLALKYGTDNNFFEIVNFVEDLWQNFRKSWQMLEYSAKLNKFSDNFENVMEIYLSICARAIALLCGSKIEDKIASEIAKNFSVDALVNITKECNKIMEKRNRNCNFNALLDSFLFMILEVRHKWPI